MYNINVLSVAKTGGWMDFGTRESEKNYRINKDEWNEVNATLIISNNERNVYLQSIKERIDWGLKRLGYIIGHWRNRGDIPLMILFPPF